MHFIEQLAPLPVVLPMIVAALLAGVGGMLPRWLIDGLAILAVSIVLAACCLLVGQSSHGTIVYWFGNWRPDPQGPAGYRFPIGICFTIDPIGAGMAGLVALLALASFVFSWAYFEAVKSLYHALMLVLVAAMCGLCLTGDLFNLFVWFELMTAAAVGLCGYKSEESGPLLGALNFAVVNSIGAFISLTGIAILYARTGSLNMAEVARGLVSHPAGDAFVLAAFLLVITGFLVKAAIVPFQFWLADAHAVAPTPVCILFSGVMVELGLYAAARLYWVVFAPALDPAAAVAVRRVFVLAGILTAVSGAIYCFGQRHLKRLLAFSTVSHTGLMLIGLGLLDTGGLAGAAVYVVGHGLVKGALFLSAGMILHRCGSVDEFDLRGKGKGLAGVGVVLAVAAIALAGMPPFATFFGESLMRQAAGRLGFGWVCVAVVVAEALTAGAVLRVTARIFLGWGSIREATSRGSAHIPMDTETAAAHDKTPATMWGPAVALLAIAAVVAVPEQFRAGFSAAAGHFTRSSAIAAVTLDRTPDAIPIGRPSPAHFGLENAITIVAVFAAVLLALFPQVLGRRLNWVVSRRIVSAMKPLRRLQSGCVGDYVAWLAAGVAVYGGLLMLWRR
jgi:multicomponent Na+:H+ antiporter subunit D